MREVACRSCGNPNLETVLSLGDMPLANALLTEEQLRTKDPRYPLELVFCPSCTLVQITETIPPEKLFSKYSYFSAYSETMLRESGVLADQLTESRNLNSTNLVVELGSNDGYQLQYFASKGIPVLGIDPAQNVTDVANAKGIPTKCAFFGEAFARELRSEGTTADIIIAKNVLAHVADLNGFVEGIRVLLKENGVAIIEVPYIKDIIDRSEFDTIYHEHLCYFSVTALERLFKSHRLSLTRVGRISIHGGSIRVQVAHESNIGHPAEPMLREEADWGVQDLAYYRSFGRKVKEIKHTLTSLLKSLKNDGKHLAAYGAAAKGAVLLNYCGIGDEILDFVADVSPHKQGRYMPGVHLPIEPPSRLLTDRPDYTLLLAWNISDEVINQQSEYIHQGGKFIVPIPTPKIIGQPESNQMQDTEELS